MNTTNYSVFQYTLAAGQSVLVTRRFRHVRGLAGDFPYKIGLGEESPQEFQTGLAFNSPISLQRLELINTAAVSQTIKLALADGPIDDNRLVGQIDISGGIRAAGNREADYGAISVGTSATLIKAANTNRGTILLQPAGEIFVGPDASVTTANGIKVPANANASFTLQTPIYAICAAGTVDTRFLEESL